MTRGVVEAHFLKCPNCPGRARLDTHSCPICGATAVGVDWTAPTVVMSPELAMVSARDNMRIGSVFPA